MLVSPDRSRARSAVWLLALMIASCRGELPSLSPPRPAAGPLLQASPASTASTAPPRASAPRSRRHAKAAVVGVVNLNRATESELRLLPGIGKGRALAIVERRAQRPFSSLAEVARIRGMKGIVRKLRNQLALEGETTLRPARPLARSEQAAAAGLGSPPG